MLYSTQELATLSGVSARTLRYYDQIGLLTPPVAPNGYRQYGPAEVKRLQLILAYRALAFSLDEIGQLLALPEVARLAKLRDQRAYLDAQIARLIQVRTQLEVTLTTQKGETPMSDQDKFAAFKQARIAENDAQFGAEVTARYGQAAKAAADQRYAGLMAAQYTTMQAAEATLAQSLRDYLAAPALPGAAAASAYAAHRQWLLATTPQLTPAMHRAFGEMYVADERFTVYYTKLVGDARAAAAMHAIIEAYTK
ncbi:MerR family transcriptional regulator [Lacticaseibacillus daqingensis]|uniref:MerR family transcriptional regulator n=1 Tax=Lacticaseibacillus daqingensis TaxID=2486014 RepID=UPI000F770ACE|nr:MerR family transcriptional regulator [Lacticaseibacillus daqingensis]